MSEPILKIADELAEKWHTAFLESYKARFRASHACKDYKALRRDCKAMREFVAQKSNLCEAFAAGFYAAMDRQS